MPANFVLDCSQEDYVGPRSNFEDKALEIGKLVSEKNKKYGDSFKDAGKILRTLFPDGISVDQYDDVLAIARIVDKLFRISHGNLEDSYEDIAGYGILGAVRNDVENKE